MPLHIGSTSNPGKLYVGTDEVLKVYLGADEVWPNSTTPPANYTDDLTFTLALEHPGVNAAPSPVWFEVTSVTGAAATTPSGGDVYDPQYHDITYIWDFDDVNNATPTTTLNLPNQWKDLNEGRGRRVAHVFNDPGTYTVTCTAYEPATRRFGTQTIEVTIGDPDVVFAGAGTIIVDPALGNHSAAHPGATVVADWASARAPRTTVGLSPARIMLAPGYFATLTEADGAWNTSNWLNARTQALDPNGAACGFRPQGKHLGGKNNAIIKDENEDCIEHVYIGITIEGEWDPTTERGRLWDPFYTDKDSDVSVTEHLLMHHQCSYFGLEGVRRHNLDSNTGLHGYSMYSDTLITNWQDYGLFLEEDNPGDVAVIGCSIAQNPDALSGGSKNNQYNGHGPIRVANVTHSYIAVCDLFSRHGWSNGGSWSGVNGTRTSNQPCIRMNTNGDPDKSSYVDRCAAEGILSYQEQDAANASDQAGNHVVDKVLQVLGADNALQYGNLLLHGGMTVRNMLSIKLDAPSAGIINMHDFIAAGPGNGGSENDDAGFRAYNNTLIDLRSASNGGDQLDAAIDSGFSVVQVENNILHAPNHTSPTNSNLNTTSGIAGFAARHKGPRYGFLHQEGTLAGDVADGGSFEVPYAEITDALYNLGGNTGIATDQAYWQAIAGTDTSHWIVLGGTTGTPYFADEGTIAVTPTATGLQVTNNTGGTWSSGTSWRFKPARDSLLPAFDPQYSSVGETIPTGVPQTGSAAIDAGDTGLSAYDDFFGVERPAAGNEQGALLE